MLIGTATEKFGGIEKVGEPLYEMFRIQNLEPLNTDECQKLWEVVTGKSISYKKIRPIQILTGGNPRLLTIISDFAAGNTFKELMDNLTLLVDEYTNYFKSNIENLPPMERKVFVILAGIWEPATAHQIAQEARITVREASAFLNRLVFRGAVVATKEIGTKKTYQVAERLYNIYYLMRRSHIPSDRVQAVVHFMVDFYEGKELASKMASLSLEACSIGREDGKFHVETYKQVFNVVHSDRDKYLIIESTTSEFFDRSDFTDILDSVKPYANKQEKNKDKYSNNHSAAELKRIALSTEKSIKIKLSKLSDSPELWAQLGCLLHSQLERYTEAEEAYRHAISINPNYFWAWARLGWLLHRNLERYPEAEQYYRKAISINPEYAWVWAHLGWLLHDKTKRYQEAEEAYRKSISIDPKHKWVWEQLGDLYFDKLNRYQEAEEAYRKSISIEPDCFTVWGHLGKLLHEKLERYQEAEVDYRKAIKINTKYAWVWAQLGWLLHNKLKRYQEAEEAYRTAIDIDPTEHWAYERLGDLYCDELERYQEAEKAYKEAIRLDPNCDSVWANLGYLLHEKLGNYQEAERAYRKSISINPNYAWAWAQLGGLLHSKLKRYQEAEEAYRTAINVDPKEHWVWERLGDLLCRELERYKEAEEAYRKAISLKPDCYTAWAQLGYLLDEKLERYQEAEEAYKKSITINPDYSEVRAQLMGVQIRRSVNFEEMYDTALKYLEAAGKTDETMNSLAWAIYKPALKFGFQYAETLVRDVVRNSPASPYYQHTLAVIMAAQGKWKEALEIAPNFLNVDELGKQCPKELISFFTSAAAEGFANKSLQILIDSQCAPYVEPLIVALKMINGDEYNAPQEVIEVAMDIIKEIDGKKSKPVV